MLKGKLVACRGEGAEIVSISQTGLLFEEWKEEEEITDLEFQNRNGVMIADNTEVIFGYCKSHDTLYLLNEMVKQLRRSYREAGELNWEED